MLRSPAIAGVLLLLSAMAWGDPVDCGSVATMVLEHADITGAQIAAGGDAGAAAKPYCRIQITSKPTADSDIRIELWVPDAGGWNGKFEQVGNGGFAGALPYRSMAHALALGYAVAGTDDGHQSSEMTDAAWALDHPEKLKDFAWRAIDETTRQSKRVLRRLTSREPTRSYFVGCSDGGREALLMAQRFPAYFDGIIAGAPWNSATRVLTSGALRMKELNESTGPLAAPELALLQRHALQTCAKGAPYIEDPRQCRVDPAALQCRSGESADCLSRGQVKTANIIYAERNDPASGLPLYAVMPGAEALEGGWHGWIDTTHAGRAAGTGFVGNYLAYLVMRDPKFDFNKVTQADLIRGERLYGPLLDAENPDLKAFKAHGGKLIQYHGWNDPAIPPGYSLEYRARVAAQTGGLDDFYRLYMVPGMLHCGGGDAPTQVNWQAALENWVEQGSAPAAMTAGDGKGTTRTLLPVN